MKNLLIALLIAFASCSPEEIADCGIGCEIILENGNPNCGIVVGGVSGSNEDCEFGSILVHFNGTPEDSKEFICLNEENMFSYPIHSVYCRS